MLKFSSKAVTFDLGKHFTEVFCAADIHKSLSFQLITEVKLLESVLKSVLLRELVKKLV